MDLLKGIHKGVGKGNLVMVIELVDFLFLKFSLSPFLG